MQCSAASIHMQVGATARPQVQRQAQACLAAAAPRQGWAPAAKQPAQRQQRQAARRSDGGRRLAVTASSVYGSEWSTPKDGYLPVVRALMCALPCSAVRGMRRPLHPIRAQRAPGFPQRPCTIISSSPLRPSLPASPPASPQGLAHCYAKNDEGKLVDQFVIEPITAAALECMAAGGKTSFAHVFSMRLGEALQRDRSAFPPEFADAAFCEDYDIRCDACARTWMRPHPLDNLL